MKKILFILIYTLAFGLLSKFIYSEYKEVRESNRKKPNNLELAVINYNREVTRLANNFNLSPSYLMALIMLESSGKRDVPVRYEKRIYKMLLKLKKGKLKNFENITQDDIKNLSTRELKLLSCSFGPFQIMGYKSYILGISLDTLRGKKHMYYAVKWIDMTYGNYVRENKLKDAFHIHNAGRKFPEDGIATTFDPMYVENGLKYEKYFRDVLNDIQMEKSNN